MSKYSTYRTIETGTPSSRSSVLSTDEYEAREAAIRNRARRDQANTSAAEARAEAARARAAKARPVPARPDAKPPATGPAETSARRPTSSPALRRARSVTRRLGSKHPRRLLVAELFAVGIVLTVSQLSDGEAPMPSRYISAFLVYLVLFFMTDLSEGSARLAAAFGLLVLAATVLGHGTQVAATFSAARDAGPHNPPTGTGHHRAGGH